MLNVLQSEGVSYWTEPQYEMKGCRNGKNIYIMPFASFLVILKCN
jgi:hypothetical protein